MFGWLTERRRAKLLERPFPPAWDAHLDELGLINRLDAEQRQRLRDLVQVFIAEKHWEGCGGLELTEEMQVTIAAQACFLLLNREHALYADVDSILVYPSAMVAPARDRAFFDPGGRVVDEARPALLGEAHLGGPVILAWDDVLAGARGKGRRNVVFHELAHKIDMVDGTIDGTPPLEGRGDRRTWAEVCSEVYLELRASVEAGTSTWLDEYGATNEAEFFAVATEAFFMRPDDLEAHHRELYAVLADFYKCEPRQQPVPPDPARSA
ncbi:MAG: zinc-dependent peptidase [Deltaproteobacteria bacterium]|nr:zinc-dependent peptidase [Deltaproteobacteria bacterium]